MGVYINPKGETKENFLKREGSRIPVQDAYKWTDFTNEFLVCLVDNGSFTAAGVAFDAREHDAWMVALKKGDRPMIFFIVPKEALLGVSNLASYMSKDEPMPFMNHLKEV